MQPRLVQLEPVGCHGDRLVAAQQTDDRIERLFHTPAQHDRVDAEHIGVRRQGAGAAAEHHPAARHVVELHETLRHQKRVVIGQAGDSRAKLDVPRALGCGGDDQLDVN